MTVVRVATVVEGQGEVAALPVLVRRIAAEIDPEVWVDSPRPYRAHRGSLIRAGGVATVVAAVVEQIGREPGCWWCSTPPTTAQPS